MSTCEKNIVPFRRDIPRFPSYIDPVTNERVLSEPRAQDLPTARTTLLYMSPEARNNGFELRKAKKIKYFYLGSEAPLRVEDDCIDKDAFQKEVEELNGLRKQADERSYSIEVRLNKAQDMKYCKLHKKRSDVWELVLEWERQVMVASSIAESSAAQILRLGALALYHDLVARILSFNHRLGNIHEDDFLELEKKTSCGIVVAKINRVTPIEFIDERTNVKPSLTDSFRFLVRVGLVAENRKFDHVLAENQEEFNKTYPNFAKNMIAHAAPAIAHVIDISPEVLDRNIDSSLKKNKVALEAVTWAEKFINRAREVARDANKALLNPNSPEFKSLSQEIQEYMCEGGFAELRTLHVLGMQNFTKALKLYRKARELAQLYPEYTVFYIDLADAIRDFQIEMPEGLGTLTSDDIPSLLVLEKTNGEVNIQDIEKAVDKVHPSAYKDNFLVDPDNITWGSLVKPSQITVSFDKNRPRCFKVKMIYQNPEGESTILEAEYTVQKDNQRFDLNFLEDASEIPEMYQAVLSETKSILENVKEQVVERRAGVIKPVTELPKEPIPLVRKIDKTRPVEEERTKIKTRPDQPVEIQKPEAIEDVILEPEKSKLIVDELSQRRIDRQLERLSPEDRENILEAMEKFNNGESVRFYPLKLRGPNGEILFSLRAKATVNGGSRILVTPIKGTPNFAVLATGYRKDIYRDWGIE